MCKRNKKSIIYISHTIGVFVGILSAFVYYYVARPKCKKVELKKTVKRAFKNIEDTLDI